MSIIPIILKKKKEIEVSITDSMMEEDVDFYMTSEDELNVYLQLTE